MTIDDPKLIDEIIERNGDPPPPSDGEPLEEPVIKIVKYTNAWGGTGYGVIFASENPDRYRASPFVRDPFTIFERKAPR